MCIVEFGNIFGMKPAVAFNYLKRYGGISFIDKCYEAEHQLSLADAMADLTAYCQRHGGTLG